MNLLRRHGGPYLRLTLLILAVYLLYLPWSGYTRQVYDAELYWYISVYFHKAGRLSLLNFHDGMRGYVWPLLLLPARVAQFVSGLPPIWFARGLGALSAAVGFGWLAPAVWTAATGAARPLAWPRRLAFAGLGFLFWRDHFTFTLSDFPALWLLLLSVLVLRRRPGRVGWAGLAGTCLAAALNTRPVYLVAAPVVLALAWVAASASNTRLSPLRSVLALLLGAALVLAPQWLINRRHFGQDTPLVLAQDANIAPGTLYRFKLQRGLVFQKYETSMAPDYPEPVLFFLDPNGRRLLRQEHIEQFGSLSEYLGFVARHPAEVAASYLRHLFNGLDVQYPTPYLLRVYQPTWLLAGLNYTIWFGAGLVLWQRRRGWRQLRPAQWLLLAALLLPCLAVLPTDIECRYLLPLHLLLYAVLCFGGQWPQFGRAQWTLVVGAYLCFLMLCFAASAAVQARLELGGRALSGAKLPPPAQP